MGADSDGAGADAAEAAAEAASPPRGEDIAGTDWERYCDRRVQTKLIPVCAVSALLERHQFSGV